ASQEEDRGARQGPAAGWGGDPGSAGRHRSRPPWRQHHGVLQGLQRADRAHARQRHPRRDHHLRGPLVHVRHQDPARGRADQEGRRTAEGIRCPAQGEGRSADQGPGARDRDDQAARPERQRRRRGDEDRRGHRPVDGYHHRV
ncbi:MAG: LSU ribosomal protein L11p (L12e), partial [uncultured Nocardioidaceae bacterium]